MGVYIDGEKYLPAKEVVVNREQFLKLLVDEFGLWNGQSYEEAAQSLWVCVCDDPFEDYAPDNPTIAQLLDKLGDERS